MMVSRLDGAFLFCADFKKLLKNCGRREGPWVISQSGRLLLWLEMKN